MKIQQVRILATGFLLPTLIFPVNGSSQVKDTRELPNILWIVSEDNSAYYTGCYGNSFATTPNIDKLADEGFLYTHAYCPNAVCAPSRNTILTGVYSSANGNENMRSSYAKSDIVRTYPEYLREAGYYCTNNDKTDYNTDSVDPNSIWDESSGTAHYNNRPDGKPFFAVFNSMISHESSLFREIVPIDELRHDPAKVTLPPYHPDTPDMRHDWARYYDCIEDMDTWVGQLLQELEDNGLADNTIVFYYGDNGGVLPRSKRFVYETGTQIPLVIRIPEKYKNLYLAAKPGDKIDRLINFPDLLPTLLSIIGVPVPDYLQGNAFLGEQETASPEYTFMSRQRMDERFDNVRAARDKKYRYIRNYMPFRIAMQHVAFLFNARSAQSWEDAFYSGKTNEVQSRFFMEKPVEELYDTENDPWEVNNLADVPAYAGVLTRMRKALDNWRMETRDAGMIPETEYKALAGDQSLYDYVRSDACPFDELIKASDLSVMGGPEYLETFKSYLKNGNSAIRYWGAVGLLMIKDEAPATMQILAKATNDRSASVATIAAEALYRLGKNDQALKTYIRILNDSTSTMTDRNFALNSIDAVDAKDAELVAAVKELYDKKTGLVTGFARYSVHDLQMSGYLLKKWGVKID